MYVKQTGKKMRSYMIVKGVILIYNDYKQKRTCSSKFISNSKAIRYLIVEKKPMYLFNFSNLLIS